ncbi:DUF5067 domain-containing protein [Staphylococcus haemolyticus]|jgi:hypothetical protein|uniref:DUF5067 domain-containing protein n=1 Tax=Staphylococcus haemolyticus TaxID=1283 RepID=UPI0011AA7209|nr:DUF5067 domain-containing protein [Staphylococcus haemolyticus]
MKKFLALIFSSALILGACGNDNTTNDEQQSNNTETKSINENKTQFKDDTLVIDQAVLKIDDTFILNDKDSDDKLLAFKYHVKNKSDSEDITSMNVWIACFEATQDSDNTVNKLDVGITPTTGKLGKWNEHSNDTIKKGKTAKGIMTYKLQNDEDVVLKATKGADGKKLGTKTIKLDDLKSEDYSVTEDLTDNSGKNDNDSKNQTVANSSNENTNSTKETTNKNDDVSKTLNDNGQKEMAVSTQNSKETSSVPSPNQSSNNTSDESQQVDNGPSRQQYEEAQAFTKDIKENPDKYSGVGGGPALTSDAGESYDQYKQRVQETE